MSDVFEIRAVDLYCTNGDESSGTKTNSAEIVDCTMK
jgi:hypothetical protein